MANRKYFYTSAFIAVFLYFSLVFSFFYYTTTSNVKKIDAISKQTVLQLDIILEEEQVIDKKIVIKNSSNSEISKEMVKRSKSVSAKQKTDLKSLFANTNIKSKKVSKKDILNVKKSTIASRFKSKFEKDRKVNNLSVSSLHNKKLNKTIKQTATESKNDSDPYYSKIYTIISSRWNPIFFQKDLKAKVLISISNNGTFSYQFIQYSENMGFDTQLTKFLEKQKSKRYPVSPDRKDTTIEIVFKSKGE